MSCIFPLPLKRGGSCWSRVLYARRDTRFRSLIRLVTAHDGLSRHRAGTFDDALKAGLQRSADAKEMEAAAAAECSVDPRFTGFYDVTKIRTL